MAYMVLKSLYCGKTTWQPSSCFQGPYVAQLRSQHATQFPMRELAARHYRVECPALCQAACDPSCTSACKLQRSSCIAASHAASQHTPRGSDLLHSFQRMLLIAVTDVVIIGLVFFSVPVHVWDLCFVHVPVFCLCTCRSACTRACRSASLCLHLSRFLSPYLSVTAFFDRSPC